MASLNFLQLYKEGQEFQRHRHWPALVAIVVTIAVVKVADAGVIPLRLSVEEGAGGGNSYGWIKVGSNVILETSTDLVGIGTSTPTAKLDVVGDVRWSGSVLSGAVPWARLTGFPGACPPGQFVSAINGTLTCGAPGGITGSGTANYLAKFTGASAVGSSNIYDDAVNVGIGTNTPGARLEINGGLRLNATAAKPSCNSQARGTFWATKNDETGDIVEVCKALGNVDIKLATQPSARSSNACVENSATHKIYCFGGWVFATPQIFEYAPATDTVVVKNAAFPNAWAFMSCAENSLTHKIYCFAGRADNSRDGRIFEYDTVNDTLVTKVATFPTGRLNVACAEDSSTHKFYCFGGFDNVGTLSDINVYDPLADTLTNTGVTMAEPRVWQSCTENTATHRIYCLGGSGGSEAWNRNILEFTPPNTLSAKAATLPSVRQGMPCVYTTAGKIYCFGGFSGSFYDQILEYTPGTDTLVTTASRIPTPRWDFPCEKDSSNQQIYCFGGFESAGNYLAQILEYPKIRYGWVKVD